MHKNKHGAPTFKIWILNLLACKHKFLNFLCFSFFFLIILYIFFTGLHCCFKCKRSQNLDILSYCSRAAWWLCRGGPSMYVDIKATF